MPKQPLLLLHKIQKVKNSFSAYVASFYSMAMQSTAPSLSVIAAQSAAPMTETLGKTRQPLNYLATQEDAILTYTHSDMKLSVHSDASYLTNPGLQLDWRTLLFII
eukprot:CCRYP_014746-RA/>CCRYP_014746-RA protein AED:0.48 eAED:0.48 QI:0/0/0/1/0/0/2/0/105